MLKKEEGRIDWSRPAYEIFNRMRGFAPWPGAYTTFRGQSCHLWGEPVSNELREKTSAVPPGTLSSHAGQLQVSCGHTTVLRITSVKLEGRKQVTASEFVGGARLLSGELFGNT
jgi:methionyl-tRNA formyltransferase